MSLALLFHYLMLNMLVHPSSGACDLFVALFHGLYSSGSMCVGVTLWLGWGLSLFNYQDDARSNKYNTVVNILAAGL